MSVYKRLDDLYGLGYPVKMMAGGITGWIDEGFELARGTDLRASADEGSA